MSANLASADERAERADLILRTPDGTLAYVFPLRRTVAAVLGEVLADTHRHDFETHFLTNEGGRRLEKWATLREANVSHGDVLYLNHPTYRTEDFET